MCYSRAHNWHFEPGPGAVMEAEDEGLMDWWIGRNSLVFVRVNEEF